jgi:hypothetical protein
VEWRHGSRCRCRVQTLQGSFQDVKRCKES